MFNLTPAPLHGAVNRAILEAASPATARSRSRRAWPTRTSLIELAADNGTLFLCAPGSAVTARIRWLKELADSGRLGRPTLAVAHHADPGPAAWREYTGDPTPFYREGVGPVFDHGVYRLHEMTVVLGPVRRVQAMGSIAIPRRRIRGGPLTGRTIEVTTPDHVLIHLEFASGALGQLLASFGTPDTLAPWLELHLERGVVSFGGKSWELDAPVSIYTDDETDAATRGLERTRRRAARRVRHGRDWRAPLHRVPARRGDARSSPPNTPATCWTSSSRPTPRSRTAARTTPRRRSRLSKSAEARMRQGVSGNPQRAQCSEPPSVVICRRSLPSGEIV